MIHPENLLQVQPPLLTSEGESHDLTSQQLEIIHGGARNTTLARTLSNIIENAPINTGHTLEMQRPLSRSWSAPGNLGIPNHVAKSPKSPKSPKSSSTYGHLSNITRLPSVSP